VKEEGGEDVGRGGPTARSTCGLCSCQLEVFVPFMLVPVAASMHGCSGATPLLLRWKP
jgi:hypothetical protein